MRSIKIYKILFFMILLFGYCDKLFSMSKVNNYYSLALQKVKSFIDNERSFLMSDNAKELKIIVGGTAVSCITIYLLIAWLKERNKNHELLAANQKLEKELETKKSFLHTMLNIQNMGDKFERYYFLRQKIYTSYYRRFFGLTK